MNELSPYITINPEIRFGKPCIKGTRITVGDILGWLSSGMTTPEILEDYPELQEIHTLIEELDQGNMGLLEII
jgi:uncharacterized protein (DUF433 family)